MKLTWRSWMSEPKNPLAGAKASADDASDRTRAAFEICINRQPPLSAIGFSFCLTHVCTRRSCNYSTYAQNFIRIACDKDRLGSHANIKGAWISQNVHATDHPHNSLWFGPGLALYFFSFLKALRPSSLFFFGLPKAVSGGTGGEEL